MSTVLHPEVVKHIKAQVPKLAEQFIKVDGKPIEIERDWQWDLVGSVADDEVMNKARQIGASYGVALRALMRASIFPPNSYHAVFVSINREEAQQKISYVETLHDGMDVEARREIISSNKIEIELSNGNKISSFPSRAVRGWPNVDLYLDEFAHVDDPWSIYGGSSASTIRQAYGTCILSTPFGLGAFADICNGAGEEGQFKSFVKHVVPWWKSKILCLDPIEAQIFSSVFSVSELVYRFGAPNIIKEFEKQTLEIFEQEFTTKILAFGNSVLSQELMNGCTDGQQPCVIQEINFDNKNLWPDIIMKDVLDQLQHFKGGLQDCFLGVDIGRIVHASELILGNFTDRGHGKKLYTALYLTLRKAPYGEQKKIIAYLIDNLPIRKCIIDAQGIGNDLSEELMMKYSTRVLPVTFGEVSKAEMVSGLVKAFEDKMICYYPTVRMNTQLLSVQKVLSAAGRIIYRSLTQKEDTGTGQEYKAHADLFWALAMCTLAAKEYINDCKVKITTKGPLLTQLGKNGWSGRGVDVMAALSVNKMTRGRLR